MHYKQLQERVKYFKGTEEGVQTMSKISEEIRESGKAEATLSIAKNLKKLGKLTDEAISLATNLSIEQVKTLSVK